MRPRLSVVITSAGDERALERCLFAVVGQRDAFEIVVADGSGRDIAGWAADRFPDVQVLQPRTARTVPGLRWAAVGATTGDLVACTEARMVPAANWTTTLVDAHLEWPDAVAIGGTVGLDADAAPRDRALYLSEYPSFIPPAAPGRVRHLTGANVSYKRVALAAAQDLLDAGAWEPILHDRWLTEGRELRLCACNVVLQNGFRRAMAMRFHYGRQYAADRSRAWTLGRRLAFAFASTLLPAVLLARLRDPIRRAPAGTWRWNAVPWLIVFMMSWSAGEAVGYVLGRDPVDRLV